MDAIIEVNITYRIPDDLKDWFLSHQPKSNNAQDTVAFITELQRHNAIKIVSGCGNITLELSH